MPKAVAVWSVANPAGLESLSGSDGETVFATQANILCLTTKPDTSPPSIYLYFARTSEMPLSSAPLYVVVEYFDAAIGTALGLQYDSDIEGNPDAPFQRCEDQAGGALVGTHEWRRAYFLLEKPRFAHRQNLGADFRISGSPLFLRSVRLLTERPNDWEEVARVPVVDVTPLVQISDGQQLIVGGFDPAHREEAPTLARKLDSVCAALKQLGVTSHQGYVRWNLCEPVEGVYDWSVYDQFVEVYRRQNLKWVPFLIVGSAYSLPDWYYKTADAQGYVCLEHGEESDVQSLWNPVLRRHVSRFLQAFCEHYRDSEIIESILLGITGNYGEAIYPVSGNDWTADIHGEYHSHPGFWAGDPYAVQSFRNWLTEKYIDNDRLQKVWGEGCTATLDMVHPFLHENAPSDRAWLDFCDWYIGSMTEWSRFWLGETRRHFPVGDIYLCTGGDAPVEHGADFGEQCKAAAAFKAGVRITNENSDYANNFSLTRWVASASRQYGNYFSFEPAAGLDPKGIVARIYNAAASGARGLHFYYNNLFDSPETRAAFLAFANDFQQKEPLTEIAVYYPETWIRRTGGDFLSSVRTLRSRFDFAYLSDGQIADGGLQSCKAFVVLAGNVAETETWRRIQDWVTQGGLLIYPEGIDEFRSMEEPEAVFNAGQGRISIFPGNGASGEYGAFIAEVLAEANELSPATRRMARLGLAEEGVFTTVIAPDKLLFLNMTDLPKNVDSVEIPAHGIATID